MDLEYIEGFLKTAKNVFNLDEKKTLELKNKIKSVEKNFYNEDFYFIIKSLESNILSFTEKTFNYNDILKFFDWVNNVFEKIVFYENMNEKQKFYFLKELELFYLLSKNYDFNYDIFFKNLSVLNYDNIILLLFNFNEFKDYNVPELGYFFVSFDKDFLKKVEEKNAFENLLEYLHIIKDSLNIILGEYFEENINILNKLFYNYDFDTFKITALIKEILEYDSKRAYKYLNKKLK